MADSVVLVPIPSGSTQPIDNRAVTSTAAVGLVNRQVTALGGTGGNDLIEPLGSAPAGTELALPTRQVGAPPLPSGAATQATLAAVLAAVDTLETLVAAVTAAVQATEPRDVTDRGGRVLGVVSAAALPLPTGASTETTLAAVLAAVDGLETLTAALLTAVTTAVTVSGPITDAELRATAVPVTGPLTDAQLRALAVPVSGPVTDTQLRATPVPVSGTVTASGPLTDTQLRATAVPVSGPLTDTQLRASAVPISGTVTASGPLTDTQLRATAVPVSVSGVATEAKQDAGNTSVASLDTKQPSKGTAVMTGSSPVTIATDDTLMAAIKADVDKIPSKGTAVMTGATPVTIATDDTVLTGLSGKLPAAATPADASAYGSLSRIGALLLGSNGTTADLLRSGLVGIQTTFVGFLNTIGLARYNVTAPAPADGNMVPLQCDANAYLRTAEQYAPGYEDNTVGVARIEQRFSTTYITTATTTQVLSGAGLLKALVIGKAIATGTIKVIDNTSGTTANIAIITFGAALLDDPGRVITFDRLISTGIRIVTDQAFDLTVVWR